MMKTKALIYVAGPFSSPDPLANTNRAIDAANLLLDAGLVPHIPHLNYYLQERKARLYEQWLEYDFHWLRLCDGVLRLSGDSPGADREVAEARRLGLPVFLDIESLLRD